MKKRFLPLLLSLSFAASAEQITLLANGDMRNWQYETYGNLPETTYQANAKDGLLADNNGNGASGYIMHKAIDLQKTPWLHMRWRVDESAPNLQEKTKAGDDFALRFYLVTQNGIRYRTLNLVYAQNAAANDSWQSPYSNFLSDVRLFVMASAQDSNKEKWQSSSLNVGEIWRQQFGRDDTIKLVGLMTDGDNTNIRMKARYDLVVLSNSPTPPLLKKE